MSETMGIGLQDLLRRFTCTDAMADVLWSNDYEKEGVVEVVEGDTVVGPQCCRAFWDLSVLALALPSITFFLLSIWSPSQKIVDTSNEFSVFDRE